MRALLDVSDRPAVQCETTQVHEYESGAALFGYTKLYGQVPGAQAELLRVPQAQYGPIKVPDGPCDDRFLYLSDVLPTAWQAVQYAAVPPGGTVVVLGLGPIGSMACRVAAHLGAERVIGVDLVPERLERAQAHGAEVIDLRDFGENRKEVAAAVRDLLASSGPDSVIDAVGMEAHGSGGAKLVQDLAGVLPDRLTEKAMRRVGVDRLAALQLAIELVRRGGTISVSGVYGGMSDPLPLMVLFDKQVQLRMGQANVKRWIDDLLPLVTDRDVLGVEDFASHHLPLDDAPKAYEAFQQKQDGTVKVVFQPT